MGHFNIDGERSFQKLQNDSSDFFFQMLVLRFSDFLGTNVCNAKKQKFLVRAKVFRNFLLRQRNIDKKYSGISSNFRLINQSRRGNIFSEFFLVRKLIFCIDDHMRNSQYYGKHPHDFRAKRKDSRLVFQTRTLHVKELVKDFLGRSSSVSSTVS